VSGPPITLPESFSSISSLSSRYLSDAILSLQLTDPITKEHSPKVLRELNLNCQNFITGHPTHPLYMSVKMLMVAIQGLGFKHF
jgi:enhancer of mRNA-decapping protein 4